MNSNNRCSTENFEFATITLTTSTIKNIQYDAALSVEKESEIMVENSEMMKVVMRNCELEAEEKVEINMKDLQNSSSINEAETNDQSSLPRWKIKKDTISRRMHSSPSKTYDEPYSVGLHSFTDQENVMIQSKPTKRDLEPDRISQESISRFDMNVMLQQFVSFLRSMFLSRTPKAVEHLSISDESSLDVVDDWMDYIDAEFSKANQKHSMPKDRTQSTQLEPLPTSQNHQRKEDVSLERALNHMKKALDRLGIG